MKIIIDEAELPALKRKMAELIFEDRLRGIPALAPLQAYLDMAAKLLDEVTPKPPNEKPRVNLRPLLPGEIVDLGDIYFDEAGCRSFHCANNSPHIGTFVTIVNYGRWHRQVVQTPTTSAPPDKYEIPEKYKPLKDGDLVKAGDLFLDTRLGAWLRMDHLCEETSRVWMEKEDEGKWFREERA